MLVVGASHSGADIALELARDHQVVLSGRVHGEVPFDIEGRAARVVLRGLFFLANHVLTVPTPLGRRMRPEVRAHGGPLLRVKRADLHAAGVEHTEMRVARRPRRPGRSSRTAASLDVATVVWCTGFGKDLGWIDIPVAGDDGWPEQDRGASATPGLYFVGLPFLHAFASMLIGGVGRDGAGWPAHRGRALRRARRRPRLRSRRRTDPGRRNPSRSRRPGERCAAAAPIARARTRMTSTRPAVWRNGFATTRPSARDRTATAMPSISPMSAGPSTGRLESSDAMRPMRSRSSSVAGRMLWCRVRRAVAVTGAPGRRWR